LITVIIMMLAAFVQNSAFSIVSRSRNRNNMIYHLIAAVGSNVAWFVTMKFLIITQHMGWAMFIPYTIGTVSGSLNGQAISMKIEKALGLTADSHLEKK